MNIMASTTRTVQAQCPTCKQRMPHETEGVRRDDDGRRRQSMTCRACKTTTTVYEDPDGFQVNYDWPDGSEGDR
jgi:transposase-like protein